MLWLRRFRRITWPLVGASRDDQHGASLHHAFKLFDYVKVITNGGPGSATNTLALNIYTVGYTQNDFGLASAEAVVLFAIVASVSSIAVVLLRRGRQQRDPAVLAKPPTARGSRSR